MSLFSKTFEVTQNEGEAFIIGYATQPPAGSSLSQSTAIDFTGASAVFTVNQTSAVNSAQLLRLTSSAGQITFSTGVIDTVPVGIISIFITDTQTLGLPAGTWYCDLLVIQSGAQTYYASGPFVVQPSVSR